MRYHATYRRSRRSVRWHLSPTSAVNGSLNSVQSRVPASEDECTSNGIEAIDIAAPIAIGDRALSSIATSAVRAQPVSTYRLPGTNITGCSSILVSRPAGPGCSRTASWRSCWMLESSAAPPLTAFQAFSLSCTVPHTPTTWTSKTMATTRTDRMVIKYTVKNGPLRDEANLGGEVTYQADHGCRKTRFKRYGTLVTPS